MLNPIPLLFLWLFALPAIGQLSNSIPDEFRSDSLTVGGDIFTNFNENLEDEEVLEDERFLTYGRFFAINLGVGLTDFSGNRGLAYENHPPTINFSLMAFTSFHKAFVLGITQSKHSMFFASPVAKDGKQDPLGLVEVNTFRTYIGFRYYLDTVDLNTALTYSNPYFALRFEYWNLTNKFVDRPEIQKDSGGGTGIAVGGGLEFPIQLKKSYINYEFLVHAVNYHDRLHNHYQDVLSNLSGLGFSNTVNYVISW